MSKSQFMNRLNNYRCLLTREKSGVFTGTFLDTPDIKYAWLDMKLVDIVGH